MGRTIIVDCKKNVENVIMILIFVTREIHRKIVHGYPRRMIIAENLKKILMEIKPESKGKPGEDCSWVPSRDDNCRKSQEDSDGNQTGKQVKFYCPQECKSKCAATNPPTRGKCENDPDFLYKGKPGEDCSWVPSRDDNCRKSQEDSDGNQTGKQVKFYCPQGCKSKCR